MRVLLKIAYDGTNYKGWQKVSTGPSIQEKLEDTISELLSEKIELIGLSRTDASVHAKSNYAVFDTTKNVNADKIYYAINDLLPNDISILESKEVDSQFHPRKVPSIKTYIYYIHNAKVRDPLKEHFSHFVWYDINIDKMREAAKYLVGEHSFVSFVNPDCQAFENKNIDEKIEIATRNISSIDIDKKDDIISIKIVGDGFLYNMVRIISGTLLKVGMGMWEPSYVSEILDKNDRKYAGFTLPGKGLVLENVDFL